MTRWPGISLASGHGILLGARTGSKDAGLSVSPIVHLTT